MKYIFKAFDHLIGLVLWLFEMWIFSCLISVKIVFGFLWDFKNHLDKKLLDSLKHAFLSVNEYTLTNIANEVSKATKEDVSN